MGVNMGLSMQSTRALLTTLGVMMFVVGCTQSLSGRSQFLLISEREAISSSRQAYMETLKDMQKRGKLSSDRKVNDRLQQITDRLIEQAVILRPDSGHWAWQVSVIDDPEVNAWCMAGGKMAIYTGLLVQLQPSDDELAQVMGHEISHALANHTAERMSIALLSSLGMTALGAVSDADELTLMASAVAAKLAIELPNSRDGESEADKIGIELAAKAGFDPDAAVSLWRKMGELKRSRMPEFLRTHPLPKTRQSDLKRLASQVRHHYLAAIEAEEK